MNPIHVAAKYADRPSVRLQWRHQRADQTLLAGFTLVVGSRVGSQIANIDRVAFERLPVDRACRRRNRFLVEVARGQVTDRGDSKNAGLLLQQPDRRGPKPHCFHQLPRSRVQDLLQFNTTGQLGRHIMDRRQIVHPTAELVGVVAELSNRVGQLLNKSGCRRHRPI